MSEIMQPTKREAIRRILLYDLLLRTGIPALLILIFSFLLSDDPMHRRGEWLVMFMIVLITGTALSGVAGLLNLLTVALKKSS